MGKANKQLDNQFKRQAWNNRTWPQRVLLLCIVLIFIITAQAYAISEWYINKHKNEPLNIGVTFISNYARYLGLDPQETFKALRDDLGFKRFRLVTYWKDIEATKGNYNFGEIDWQLKMIEEVGGTATVAIGLRQPRWPECHFPQWASSLPKQQWQSDLDSYMTQVIQHLKNNKVVTSYQLENEYFLTVFGECPQPSREQLIHEYNLVKNTDPRHPIIMSLANNYFGVPVGQPLADQFGVSVYKRVWDQTVTKRYFEYPFTPRYYAYRAGLTELLTGKSSMLHELQGEPWPPKDVGIINASIAEQNKSMNTEILKRRINYGIDAGFRDIDLWGGEWWYWRKTQLNDPSLWEIVRNSLQAHR